MKKYKIIAHHHKALWGTFPAGLSAQLRPSPSLPQYLWPAAESCFCLHHQHSNFFFCVHFSSQHHTWYPQYTNHVKTLNKQIRSVSLFVTEEPNGKKPTCMQSIAVCFKVPCCTLKDVTGINSAVLLHGVTQSERVFTWPVRCIFAFAHLHIHPI